MGQVTGRALSTATARVLGLKLRDLQDMESKARGTKADSRGCPGTLGSVATGPPWYGWFLGVQLPESLVGGGQTSEPPLPTSSPRAAKQGWEPPDRSRGYRWSAALSVAEIVCPKKGTPFWDTQSPLQARLDPG